MMNLWTELTCTVHNVLKCLAHSFCVDVQPHHDVKVQHQKFPRSKTSSHDNHILLHVGISRHPDAVTARCRKAHKECASESHLPIQLLSDAFSTSAQERSHLNVTLCMTNSSLPCKDVCNMMLLIPPHETLSSLFHVDIQPSP